MSDGRRLVRRLVAARRANRRTLVAALDEAEARRIDADWPAWVHRGQEEPEGTDWRVWVMLAGRGFGKTRAGAEWVSALARAQPGAAIALVAATVDEARRVMIEGRSGLLAVARREELERMRWEPSRRRLVFASGAEAFVFSGAHADGLRGPEHHFAWCDELAKWGEAEAAWTNLMLGLRLGERPRALVTTTPRPLPMLRAIIGDGATATSGGATADNPHLAAAFVADMARRLGGTRLGRQELEGEMVDEVEGALWPRELIEACRAVPPARALRRVVIGVDPPAGVGGGVRDRRGRARQRGGRSCAGGSQRRRAVAGRLGPQGRGGGRGARRREGGRRGEQWRRDGGDGAARGRTAAAGAAGPCRRGQGGAGGAGRHPVRERPGEAGGAFRGAGERAGGAELERGLSGARAVAGPGRRDGVGDDRADAEAAGGAAHPDALMP